MPPTPHDRTPTPELDATELAGHVDDAAPPQPDRSVAARPWRRPRRWALLVSALVFGMWMAQEGDSLLIKPGPMFSVADAVALDTIADGDRTTGQIAFPTAAATSATRYTVLRCALTEECHTRKLELLSPDGPDPAAESLTLADDAATLLAADRVTDYPNTGWPQAPGAMSQMPGIQGPSAGLAVALHLLDVRTPGDLVAGKRVAATGTIDATGKVGTVGEVPYKLASVTAWDADVFFAPVGSSTGLPTTAVTVVEVSSLDEATRWLCDNGGSGALCSPAQP